MPGAAGDLSYARPVGDRETVRAAFSSPAEFTTSPLYRSLSRTVAGSDRLLDLACLGRPGQYPTFLFFGAVQYLLLAGADHRLARYYPSIAGEQALPARDAGPALLDFCREFEAALAAIVSTRLVQTNQVQRSLGLRLGLSVIAAEVTAPVHVIEVGTSAGLNLRFDRYGYLVGGRQFGDPASPVQITAAVHGLVPVPDLDRLPALASVAGVDLHPADAADPDARAWLAALVWPENQRQRALLTAALDAAAADPPPIRAGDAIDVLPDVARALPPGQPRVVFHAATRMHVPVRRRPAFDAAIRRLGESGPLWWLSIEDAPPDPDPRPRPARRGAALLLRRPDATAVAIAAVDGHLDWIDMLPGPPRLAARPGAGVTASRRPPVRRPRGHCGSTNRPSPSRVTSTTSTTALTGKGP